MFWRATDFDKDPPTRFPARRFSLPCPADLRESQQTTAYPRCRTVKGLTSDCHVNFQEALIRPIVL